MKPANAIRHRLAVAPTFGLDTASGSLTGLQLMAANREACGHGFWIDAKTLETALAAVAEDGGLLKGYITHNHSGPCASPYGEASEADEAASELNVAGWFSTLSIANDQLVAGRFDFYDAFKKNYAPQFEQITEMAAKTPALLGLSIEACGYCVYIDMDGNEYGAAPEGVELLNNGIPSLRVTELWAAAFVSDGACTEGLFAKLSRRFANVFRNAAPAPAAAPSPDTAPTLQAPIALQPSPFMNLLTEIKTKLGADKPRYTAALAIVADHAEPSTLTLAAVEAELAIADTEAARAALATAQAEVTRLTAAHAEQAAELVTLRAAGQVAPLALATPAISGPAGKPGNITMSTFKSLNETQRMEFSRSGGRIVEA
jgi:hypothetical protein